MGTSSLGSQLLPAAMLSVLAVAAGACMGDGECTVYEYAPNSVRVAFVDAETGERICDQPNAATPGKLIPIEGECAYQLAGWYVEGDGGVSTTVELTVKGYATETVVFEAGEGACGEPTPPSSQTIAMTPDPDTE